MTYTGPRYDKLDWRNTVVNGRIPLDLLAEVEAWPTYDRDLGGPALMHPEAAAAMGVMLRTAEEQGFGDLTISLSYRTLSKQQEKWANYLDGGNLAARPGTSNHGWGVSGDMRWGRQVTLAWLQANAPRFGFVNDVPSEAWHYTYQQDRWRLDDMTKDEKALLTWVDGLREGTAKNLGGLDNGEAIGRRVAAAVKHGERSHRHAHGPTGPNLKQDLGGHLHETTEADV